MLFDLDQIDGSRWELFDGARHMCFAEQNERYISMLADFLKSID